MAQVVVGYANEDRLTVGAFTRELKQRGLTVWWDADIHAGQQFRERIKQEIRRAACVIVVWSPTSIHKDWVRAEAALALELHKLISVCTKGVSYRDVPLPFGELHMVSVNDIDRICDALKDFDLTPKKSDTRTLIPRWFRPGRPKLQMRGQATAPARGTQPGAVSKDFANSA